MVMKHDGMDFRGFMDWLFSNDSFPYPLCPVFLPEGECF